MRLLLSILLNAVTVLSLLLLVATLALWARSYRWRDQVEFVERARPGAESSFYNVRSAGGGVGIMYGHYRPGVVGQWVQAGRSFGTYADRPIAYGDGLPLRHRGFAYDRYRDGTGRATRIVFPTWVAAAAFAVLPITQLALGVRRCRRRRTGACPACGYDLRATPDRCPECRAVPANANAGTTNAAP